MERESVGPYRIVNRLGAGGMGEVFLAFDTRLGRNVALKSLSDPSLDAPRARARLLREARAAAQISHPNIAAIYDILETGDHPCIVMEYAQGESLAALVGRGPMPCAEVLEIARQILDAVAHAHTAGVIHRDLKPANIVLTPEGVVKILDFGLARAQEAEEPVSPDAEVTRDLTETRVGTIAGTPAYMAPEQLIGSPASALSDIYSLGATLFELFAGRRPFEAATPSALAWEIVSKPTPRVSDLVPSVPGPLAAVVSKAMAKDPADRYQSAAEMRGDLRRAEQECAADIEPVVEVVPATSPGAGAPIVRTRTSWVSIAAAVVAAAALIVTVYMAVKPSRGAAPPATSSQFVAVLPFTNSSGDPAASLEAAGFTEAIVATLEGLSSVSVLSRPDAQWLPSAGDNRKAVVGSGVTRLVTGTIAGPPSARVFTISIEDTEGKVVAAKRYSGGQGIAPIQSAAVRDIATGLRVALTRADALRLERGPACRPETYREIARGRSLLDREDVGGNPLLAEEAFRKAAAGDASCALAYAGVADASWARYRAAPAAPLADAARDAITKACQLDSENPTIMLALARVYRNTGRAKLAEETVREVIKRRPVDDEPHRLLSDILDDQNRTEEAAAECAQAVALRPNNVINHLVLGIRHYLGGRYQEALASFQHVLEMQPDNEWATINTIASHAKLGNFQQAIDVYQASPVKNATMRSNLGSIYFSLNRCAEALDIMKDAVEMAPRDDVKRRNLGDVYGCLGKPSDAAREYREALAITQEMLKVNKADPAVLARRALYEAKCGLKAEALQHAEEAVRLSPDDNEVLYKAAVVHSLFKQPTRAIERLGQALEKGYSRVLARADVDLDPIKPLPGVNEMLGVRR